MDIQRGHETNTRGQASKRDSPAAAAAAAARAAGLEEAVAETGRARLRFVDPSTGLPLAPLSHPLLMDADAGTAAGAGAARLEPPVCLASLGLVARQEVRQAMLVAATLVAATLEATLLAATLVAAALVAATWRLVAFRQPVCFASLGLASLHELFLSAHNVCPSRLSARSVRCASFIWSYGARFVSCVSFPGVPSSRSPSLLAPCFLVPWHQLRVPPPFPPPIPWHELRITWTL